MAIFMMLRQAVDVLHEFKILDYAICLFAVGLILYKFIKAKVYISFASKIDILDGIVIALAVLYFLSFLRNTAGFNSFVKTESTFMLYILGRLYGKELLKHGEKVAYVSYVVVYVSFVVRVVEYVHYFITGDLFSWEKFGIANSGGVFYYKTDLGIAMIVALIFIYAFSKNNRLKRITMFPVIAGIIFTSGARMCIVILLIQYIYIFINEKRKKEKIIVAVDSKRNTIIFLILSVSILILFVVIQVSPIHTSSFQETFSEEFVDKTEQIFHSRHIIVWDNLKYYSNQNFSTRLIGIDFVSDSMNNARGDRAHCFYLKLIYTVGYMGTILLLSFFGRLRHYIVKNHDRIYSYATKALIIMFLLIGISVEAIEFSQISWFPFLFAGGIVTSTKNKEGRV